MNAQVFARLRLMCAQGVLRLFGFDRVQASVLDGEVLPNLLRVEPYGFSYHPLPDSQVYLNFPAGDRSLGLALIIGDRRYQMNLEQGEVALHDDQGQVVHLTRDGIVIRTAKKLRLEAADIEMHASHSYSWDVAGFGERWTAAGGGQFEHKTWQMGAVVTSSSLPINAPEGP